VILAKDPEIKAQANWFYRALWTTLGLDNLEMQELANCVFNACVNQGAQTSVKALQHILNALCPDDIPEDGNLGPKTQDRLSSLMSVGRGPLILDAFEAWRKSRYVEVTFKNRKLQRYIGGWFNRVNRGQ
jgi:lysozyme family protein